MKFDTVSHHFFVQSYLKRTGTKCEFALTRPKISLENKKKFVTLLAAKEKL